MRLLKFNEEIEADTYTEVSDAEYLQSDFKSKMENYKKDFRSTANKIRSVEFRNFKKV